MAEAPSPTLASLPSELFCRVGDFLPAAEDLCPLLTALGSRNNHVSIEMFTRGRIDVVLRAMGEPVLSHRTPEGAGGVAQMIRLLHVLEKGEMKAWTTILSLAKCYGFIDSLPLTITPADIRQLPSKAQLARLPVSMGQYALFAHRLVNASGERLPLELGNDGEVRLEGLHLTVYDSQTLPLDHPFAKMFDVTDPPCTGAWAGLDFRCCRDLILWGLRSRGHTVAHTAAWELTSGNTAEEKAAVKHLTEPGDYVGVHYGGGVPHPDTHQADFVSCTWGQPLWRLIFLSGHRSTDTYAAQLLIMRDCHFCSVSLHTTEEPVSGMEGADRFPLTCEVAKRVMGAAAFLLFGRGE
ncbi:unnamed protein product [Vitrella brassicaformis CCMP3155]|uniref:Uncharacterized protein n=1 Tax=Vitrella brassicaformis (strain CCMP3155) TaxID=1169540 RepID=A0A0G4GIW4_VITBC|nr:unnamed protein product [Vitrella brassicaformis CCMP3155]|eukprot:CEM29698.1 unnamed protein product [Vitrella brassicaformis CCMP3155]